MEFYIIVALIVLVLVCTMASCVMIMRNLNISIVVKHEYPERTVETGNMEVPEAEDDVSFDDLLKEVNAFMLDDDEVKDNG